MALANAIINGSYSTVTINAFVQQSKEICFTVTVWQDNTKTKKLADLDYQFHSTGEIVETLPNRGINELPLNPVIGDSHLIGPNPIGAAGAFDHGDQTTWFGDENGWVKNIKMAEGSTYYIQEEDIYALWNGTDFYELRAYFSEATWATYFDLSVLNLEGSTILKGCYEYLKLTEEFSTTVDA